MKKSPSSGSVSSINLEEQAEAPNPRGEHRSRTHLRNGHTKFHIVVRWLNAASASGVVARACQKWRYHGSLWLCFSIATSRGRQLWLQFYRPALHDIVNEHAFSSSETMSMADSVSDVPAKGRWSRRMVRHRRFWAPNGSRGLRQPDRVQNHSAVPVDAATGTATQHAASRRSAREE